LALTILDEYWLDVQRSAATNELQKRKAENLELEITPQRVYINSKQLREKRCD
jgi:hypothetical protein